MKSFKKYSGEQVTQESGATAEELTRKIAAAYDGKSSMDMMRSILAEAEKANARARYPTRKLKIFIKRFRLCWIAHNAKNCVLS